MPDVVKDDIALANAVSTGITYSREFFVDEYTDLVLSRVWNLAKTHCRHPFRERVCSLIILLRRSEGYN